jgi:hypothetical protein
VFFLDFYLYRTYQELTSRSGVRDRGGPWLVIPMGQKVQFLGRYPFFRAEKVKKTPVLVYSELLLCLDCGKAEFTVPKDQWALLTKTDGTAECGLCMSSKI